MAISLTTVTGSAQTGFTTPGYGVTADQAPSLKAKQWAVTSLTGTQSGVTSHSATSPFTFTAVAPATFKLVNVPNPSTGVIYPSGKNVWKFIVRKGVVPAANQAAQLAMMHLEIPVPAGADTYDASNVRALVSFGIGALNQQSAGIGDSLTSGIL